ncbi:MAG TPA: glycosyltransferase family 39 protein, partial [Bryobacteraceae bacterium]|nr:glycosyltransferase family 39 protein [Bryobacteraceae bacterium]
MLANDRNRRLILAAIVVCGFILRVWGLTFGLPLKSNLYIRPDESLLVAAAARFWDTGGHPGFFAYPALMTELCALLYLPWKLFGDGIPSAFSRDPGPFFLIARGLSVAASTASILLVHAIAKRLISATGALMAAAFFAFSPLAVRDAHFGVTDSLLVCLLLASLAWPFRNVQWPDIAALGAIFGLACSTKYTAILLAPAIGLRIIMRSLHAPKQAMRNVAIAGACCALVFVLLNPYIFLQQGDSSGQVYELFSMFYRTQPGDTTWSARHAVQQVLRPLQYGPGGPVGFALAAVGAVLLLSTRKSALPVVVAAAVCVAALLPFKHNVPYRYTLPLLPLISILAAASLEYPKRALWKNLLASLVIAFTAWNSARLVNILTRPDTRTLAGTWIEKNVPADTPILLLGPPEAEPQIHES